jgi:hypothetical protein
VDSGEKAEEVMSCGWTQKGHTTQPQRKRATSLEDTCCSQVQEGTGWPASGRFCLGGEGIYKAALKPGEHGAWNCLYLDKYALDQKYILRFYFLYWMGLDTGFTLCAYEF